MKNVTKALAYLFIMSSLLAVGGFIYHKQLTPAPVDNNTPAPVDNNTNPDANTNPDVTPTPADDSEFISKANEVFNVTNQTFQAETEKTEKKYCNVDGCPAGLNGAFDGYRYYVVVNATGNITKFYLTNDNYQFGYTGEGLFIEGISATKISDIDPGQVINITSEM